MRLKSNKSQNFGSSALKITAKNLIPEFFEGIKSGRVSKVDAMAFTTMSLSSAGYLVGGAGLLNDFAFAEKSQKNSKELTDKTVGSFFMVNNHPVKKGVFESFMPKKYVCTKTVLPHPKEKAKGCDTIKPTTKFGKVGMNFARFGVGVAGIAGIFNGISMGLPILALGEGVTMLSAPAIETPVGTGIFGIGLGLINLSRVLDSDPKFKIDREQFSKAKFSGKVAMLKENFSVTSKEMLKSVKEVGQNSIRLFGPKSKEARTFFSNKFFSLKPSKILLQEKINEQGKLVLDKIPQANPHLMHTASLGLCVASLILIGSNLLKNAFGEKLGLRMYGVSNAADNVALSKWGAEKITSAKSPSGKTTGIAFTVAGASVLAGQPGIDKNWGRGLMWNGIGLILAGFAIERGAVIMNALKRNKPPKLVRQWQIDISKAMNGQKINKKSMNKFFEKVDSSFGNIYNDDASKVEQLLDNICGKGNAKEVAL